MPDTLAPAPLSGIGENTIYRSLTLTRVKPPDDAAADAPLEFDAVLSVGAAVRRYDWARDRYVSEVLDMSAGAVVLDRLNGGATVLDSHQTYGLNAVFGNIVPGTARLESGALKARLRLDPLDPRSRKVAEGYVRSLSVGYSVTRWEVDESTDPVTVRATRWEPHEVSVVSVPADPAAMVTLAGRQAFSALTGLSIPEGNMTTPNDDTTRSNPGTQPPAAQSAPPAAVTPEMLAVERKRVADILDACTRANAPDKANKFIAEGVTADQARVALFEDMAGRQPSISVHIQRDESDPLPHRLAMAAAIIKRSGAPLKLASLVEGTNVSEQQVRDMSRSFSGMSLLRMAEVSLERAGLKAWSGARGGINSDWDMVTAAFGMRSEGIEMSIRSGGMMSTTDFPIILGDVTQRVLLAFYEDQPSNWLPFVRVTTLRDFRPMKYVQMGRINQLEELPEGAEYKTVTFSEKGETLQLSTYGGKGAITRQAILNDNLGAFSDFAQDFANAARNTEANVVYKIMTGNPVMSDGNALYSTAHKNLAAVAATPDQTSMDALYLAMGTQTAFGSSTSLNLEPAVIVAPHQLRGVLERLTAPESRVLAAEPEKVNLYAGRLQLIFDNRLGLSSPTAWYAFADKRRAASIQAAYLQGQEGVYSESRINFDVDGVEIKARIDFGAAALDHVGTYKNLGA